MAAAREWAYAATGALAVGVASDLLYTATAYDGFSGVADAAPEGPHLAAAANVVVYVAAAVFAGSPAAGVGAAAMFGLAPSVWQRANAAPLDYMTAQMVSQVAVLLIVLCNAARADGGRRPRGAVERAELRQALAGYAADALADIEAALGGGGARTAEVKAAAGRILAVVRGAKDGADADADPAGPLHLPPPPPLSLRLVVPSAVPLAAAAGMLGALTACPEAMVRSGCVPFLTVCVAYLVWAAATDRGVDVPGGLSYALIACAGASAGAVCGAVAFASGEGDPTSSAADNILVAARAAGQALAHTPHLAGDARATQFMNLAAAGTMHVSFVAGLAAAFVGGYALLMHRYVQPELALYVGGWAGIAGLILGVHRAPLWGGHPDDLYGPQMGSLWKAQANDAWALPWGLVCVGVAKAVYGAVWFLFEPSVAPRGFAVVDAAVNDAGMDTSRRQGPAHARSRWFAVDAALLILTAIVACAVCTAHYPYLNRSGVSYMDTYAEYILRPLPDRAILVTAFPLTSRAVAFQQEVKGLRRDVAHIEVRGLLNYTQLAAIKTRHPWLAIPSKKEHAAMVGPGVTGDARFTSIGNVVDAMLMTNAARDVGNPSPVSLFATCYTLSNQETASRIRGRFSPFFYPSVMTFLDTAETRQLTISQEAVATFVGPTHWLPMPHLPPYALDPAWDTSTTAHVMATFGAELAVVEEAGHQQVRFVRRLRMMLNISQKGMPFYEDVLELMRMMYRTRAPLSAVGGGLVSDDAVVRFGVSLYNELLPLLEAEVTADPSNVAVVLELEQALTDLNVYLYRISYTNNPQESAKLAQKKAKYGKQLAEVRGTLRQRGIAYLPRKAQQQQ